MGRAVIFGTYTYTYDSLRPAVLSGWKCTLASPSVSKARSARQAGLYFSGYVASLPKGRNAPKRDSWGIESDEITPRAALSLREQPEQVGYRDQDAEDHQTKKDGKPEPFEHSGYTNSTDRARSFLRQIVMQMQSVPG